MIAAALTWLATHQGPLAYALLAVAAMSEYIFPPLPGDLLTLFGIFLAGSAGYSPLAVYLSVTAGSVLGGWLAYLAGRWLAKKPSPGGLLSGPKTRALLDEVAHRFEKHGVAYLAVNRFVPVLRAFFFVGAGLAGLPAGRVLLWGTVSALAWNALLFAAGWAVGHHWGRLSALLSAYSTVALAVALLVVLVLFLRARRRGPQGGAA